MNGEVRPPVKPCPFSPFRFPNPKLAAKASSVPRLTVPTLTFRVQSASQELKNTSSCIRVSGLSTTDSQEKHWKLPLSGEEATLVNVYVCYNAIVRYLD